MPKREQKISEFKGIVARRGYLGKEVRVPIPACAVTKIRETFPSEDAEYRGFIDIKN